MDDPSKDINNNGINGLENVLEETETTVEPSLTHPPIAIAEKNLGGNSTSEEKIPPTKQPLAATTNLHDVREKLEDLNKIPSDDGSIEQQPSTSITVAESIAKLRAELEKKIIFEGLPRSEWREAYNEALLRYPESLPYRAILDNVIAGAEKARDQLDEIWLKHHGEDRLPIKEVLTEKANSQAAQELFKELFEIPIKEVDAFKGAFTLRFMVEDDDYKRMLGKDKGEELMEGATAHKIPGYSFPVLVLRKNLGQEIGLPLAHELEHGKNRITERSRLDAIVDRRAFSEEVQWRDRVFGPLGRRYHSEEGVNSDLKNELLAYFTPFEFIDQMDQSNREIIENEYIEEIKKGLLDKKGLYLPSWKRGWELNRQEVANYRKNVNRGFESFLTLRNTYLKEYPEGESARLTINVLEQFPLHYWPAVARLILRKHSIEAKQVEEKAA